MSNPVSWNSTAILENEEDVQLYDAITIDFLEWPETEEASYAKRFLEPLIKNGISSYVDNICADVFALKIEQFVLPIVVATGNYENAYICSPYGHYVVLGGVQSTQLIENPVLSKVIQNLLKGLGRVAQSCAINSVVYVNHWLSALDLYPVGLTEQHLLQITNHLKKRFPTHAIVFRSLTPLTNAALVQCLKKQGYDLLASRHVFVTDTNNDFIFNTRIVKSDLRLWRENKYEIVDESQICPEDYPTLLQLYRLLYLTRYPDLQPQYNERYIQMVFDQHLLQFKILKLDGRIKGVAGYYDRGGVMYCPFFGYDKEEEDHSVVYRLLSTALLLEAKKKRLVFNQSAGASFYKKIRRAEGCLESMALYTQHLPPKQRLSWSMFRSFVNSFAPRFMEKY